MTLTAIRNSERKDAKPYGNTWRCSYWYPSNVIIGDDVSEHLMHGYKIGNEVVMESLPSEDHSYMFVRLKIEDNVASGTWQEVTSPTGEFKGAVYNGTGQLIVNPETGGMEGRWSGAGWDRKLKQMRIYAGRWEIFPATEQEIENLSSPK